MPAKRVYGGFEKRRFRFCIRHYSMLFKLTLFSVARPYCINQNNGLYRRLLLRCTIVFHIRTIEHGNSVRNIFTVVNCRGRAGSDEI